MNPDCGVDRIFLLSCRDDVAIHDSRPAKFISVEVEQQPKRFTICKVMSANYHTERCTGPAVEALVARKRAEPDGIFPYIFALWGSQS
jgi:hypothetical protein